MGCPMDLVHLASRRTQPAIQPHRWLSSRLCAWVRARAASTPRIPSSAILVMEQASHCCSPVSFLPTSFSFTPRARTAKYLAIVVTCSTCSVAAENTMATVSCPAGAGVISRVTFASFGLPVGSCSSGLSLNTSCNSANATAIVSNLCVGSASCSVPATSAIFGSPCATSRRHFSVLTILLSLILGR